MLKKTLFVLMFLVLHNSYTMEPVDNSYLFAAIPNRDRRLFILPLIMGCKTITDARNILFSIGLVAKQSYEQIKCPFFMRDVINMLVAQHHFPHESIAKKLKMPGAEGYRRLGDDILKVIHSSETAHYSYINALQFITDLIRQGADCNFRSSKRAETALMRSVRMNKIPFVTFFINKKARVNEYNIDGMCVRNFNLIYNKEQLKEIIAPILHYVKTKKMGVRIDTFNLIEIRDCTRKLQDALVIDRMLEDCQARNDIREGQHPLIE